MPDLISIVMPIKNEESFLSDCLNSILQQTEKNWELLAVDDHSTDGTASILTHFAKADSRIKPLKNKGSGIIDALQTGYQNSSGNFITRMDADDLMTPRKLELLKNALLLSENELAVGKVKYFSDTKLGDGYIKYEKWLNKLTSEESHFTEIYKECVIPSPCWMTSRAAFAECGGFDSERYPEDYDLAFRFYENWFQVTGIQEVIHLWRDHPNRTSRNDDNYADNRFLDLKLHYFSKLDRETDKPLVIWGAGKKGKSAAKYFSERKEKFHWVTNNPKKIGHKIYDVELEKFEILSEMKDAQILIFIAASAENEEVHDFLISNDLENYFFFC